MWRTRSPGSLLVWCGYFLATLAGLLLLLMLTMPNVGVVFVPSGQGVAALASDTRTPIAQLKPDDMVVFSSPAGTLRQRAAELASDFAPSGRPGEIADWYQRRSELLKLAGQAPARLTVPTAAGPGSATLRPHPRSLSDLSIDVWLLLAQGCVIGLLGCLVLVLKPRDTAARIFALSCFGVLIAAFSGAVFDARELTANGDLLRWAQGVNFIGSDLCAAGIVALFLHQPKRLVPTPVSAALLVVAMLGGLANGLGWVPLSFFYAEGLVLSGGFLCLLLVQWIIAKGDPAARAVLRWVGVTSFLAMTSLSVAMAAPQMFGLPSLGGDGLSFLPLFVVYGGIAFGIGRYRLIDLDRWSYRLLLGAAGAVAFLAADAILAGAFGLSSPKAFAFSVLVIGYLYLPARAYVQALLRGRAELGPTELFQSAAEVAFAADPRERRLKWRLLLTRLFDPLEIQPLAEFTGPPQWAADGVELWIPAAADGDALKLLYRAKGRKLFDPGQVLLARQLVKLMKSAEGIREEYTRGVVEERNRIARDLHDDVSARLLTSLHREDLDLVRSDVRKAMADIRTVVSSLSGDSVSLDQVLADLRFETAGRLKSAGLTLDWPLTDVAGDAAPLDYAVYKGLISSHREIVSNILRHAGAKRVVVSVGHTREALHISVQDDGSWSAPAQLGGRVGRGLRNIADRLHEVGGSCSLIDAEPGTRVQIRIPLSSVKACSSTGERPAPDRADAPAHRSPRRSAA